MGPTWRPLVRYLLRRHRGLGAARRRRHAGDVRADQPRARRPGRGQPRAAARRRTRTIVAAYRAHYGLDRPLPVQYVTYLGQPGAGRSRRVAADPPAGARRTCQSAVPATLEIAIGAIVLSVLIGVGFGVVAAVRRGRLADSALRLVSLVGHLGADVLAGAGGVLRLLLPARPRSRARAALARHHTAAARHRPVHGRLRCSRGSGRRSATRGAPHAADAGADALHRRAAHPVHPLGRAGGAGPGLRARRPGPRACPAAPCCSATCCARRWCRS